MDIEFKNLEGKFEIIEYTVRDTKLGYEAEQRLEPVKHLQARIAVNDFDNDCIDCSISYYSEDNEFLGLDDTDTLYLKPSHDKSISLSLPMDIPPTAQRAVVRFIFQDDIANTMGFYGYILKILSLLALVWLALMVFNSFD